MNAPVTAPSGPNAASPRASGAAAPATSAAGARLPRPTGGGGGGAAPGAAQATQQLYDVIVLGAQLAGTVAAALLVKRGFRVLLIDDEGLGESYDDRGYRLPYAPTLLPSPKQLPQAEGALAEIGCAVEIHRALEAGGSDLQLLLPRHRLEFPPDPERRARELGREYRGDKAALVDCLQRLDAFAQATDPFFRGAPPPLPARGLLERWALYRATRRCSAVAAVGADHDALEALGGHELAAALRGLARFLSYLDNGEDVPLARQRPLAQILRGAQRFPWGLAGLRAAVQRRLRELGGIVVGGPHEPAVIEELVFEGSRVGGVRLAHTKHLFRARHVVAAMDVETLAPLIPPKFKKRGLARLFESVRARGMLFPLNLVVRTAGLPLGLKDLALVMPPDEELGPVLLEVLPAVRGEQPVPHERVLSAAAFCSSAERDASEEEWRAFAARLEAAVMGLSPFCEGHIVLRSAPLLDAKATRAHRIMPHPLFELGAKSALGVGGLPYRTGCRNLFLASREVVPGLGLEGEFVAATRAAALVQEALKRHDPLK